MNYRGYFRGLQSDILYSVRIITDTGSTEYEEMTMAGDSPFKVSYESSKTPFEPMRKSTATFSVVSDGYYLDIFSQYATGTTIELWNETSSTIEWKGYLKPNMYNQGYVDCLETIEFEASDCLCALQYFDYEQNSDTRSIISFKQIIDNLMKKVGCDTYYVSIGKKIDSNDFSFSSVTISEQNFFSSDTDDPWTMEEVMEEICRYFGFTVIQWKDAIVFADLQLLSKQSVIYARKYIYDNGSYTTDNKSYNIGGSGLMVHNDGTEFMGSTGQLSLDTVYNKASVKCTQYELEDFIPDIWDDENCTNRAGDWNKCQYVAANGKQKYIDGKGNDASESSDDKENVYVQRTLDNKYFDSVYYKPSTPFVEVPYSTTKINSTLDSITTARTNASITVTFTNNDSVSHKIVFYFTYQQWYWDYDEGILDYYSDDNAETVILAGGASQQVTLACQFQAPTSITFTMSDTLYNFIVDGDGIYRTVGTGKDLFENYVGCTLKDVASYERIPNTSYNFEPTASLSFTRYLAIAQKNFPAGRKMYPNNQTVPIYTDPCTYADFPCVYKLKSGWSLPTVAGSNSFLAIDGNVLYERYISCNYINGDWTDTASGCKAGKLFSKDREIVTCSGHLIFKLGIGDKYWNGNAWTTTDTCFMVPISTNVDDDYEADLTKIWNSSMHILNNVSWDEWAGVNGYKIPLDGVDLNGEVTFEIHLPTKIQYYESDNSDRQAIANRSLNGYCWISDLSIQIANKGKEYDEDEDVVYENVVSEGSINEMSEITVKINTYPDKGKLSFSHCGLASGGYLKTITEPHLSNTAQKPEENIIERYVNEYSTNTKKENMTLTMDYNPFGIIEDVWWDKDNRFVILGQTIDYNNDSQEITMIQIK